MGCGGGEDMWNKADREETPSLESPGDSEQNVLLLPTQFISWLCTLAQESALPHLHFHKMLLPPACLLRNNSCLAQLLGPCCTTGALREVRQAALLLHHCSSFPLHSPFSTVQGHQAPSEAPNTTQEPHQGPC